MCVQKTYSSDIQVFTKDFKWFWVLIIDLTFWTETWFLPQCARAKGSSILIVIIKLSRELLMAVSQIKA